MVIHHNNNKTLGDYGIPDPITGTEMKSMTTIKEASEQYEPATTKNISELAFVSVDLDIYEKTFKEGTDDEFTIKAVMINGEEYRIPNSVLKDLKEIMIKKPELKEFSVSKTGEGLKTSYTVVPL